MNNNRKKTVFFASSFNKKQRYIVDKIDEEGWNVRDVVKE